MMWPRKVFIDSTALYQLGPRLETVDLAKLLRFKSLSIDFFVPEVSWREYLRQRKNEIAKCLARIRQTEADFGKYGQTIPEIAVVVDKASVLMENIEVHYAGKTEQLGLKILPLPPIDLGRLLQMSIDSVPPFEEANKKGFRDSLIMFTVLEAIRDCPEDNSLLITGDKLLVEGCRRLTAVYQTSLHFAKDIEEAVGHIGSRVTDWYKEKLRQESAEATAELLRFRDQISQRVQEIREVSDEELGQGLVAALAGRPPESIEQVLSLSFGDIESALWKEREKPASRILFKARCQANVRVGERRPLSSFQPRYRVGGGLSIGGFVGGGKTIEKTLSMSLYGEADLTLKNGSWQLENLRLFTGPPNTEDLWMLAEVERK